MKKHERKTSKEMQSVGFWATVWWAVSGLYVVLIIWKAARYYADDISINWIEAARRAFDNEAILTSFGWLVIIGWIVLLVAWLKALKQAKISYKAGLKDLFFTLR